MTTILTEEEKKHLDLAVRLNEDWPDSLRIGISDSVLSIFKIQDGKEIQVASVANKIGLRK
jgi:hypothetical protein